jgi:hypothetical protein
MKFAPRGVILTAGIVLAGCASTPDGALGLKACKDVDWYQYGWRDGSVSGLSSLEKYTADCAVVGVKPDAAQYNGGLETGRWEKAHRSNF